MDSEPPLMIIHSTARGALAIFAGLWASIGLGYAIHAQIDGESGATAHGVTFFVVAIPFALLAMRASPLRLTRDYLELPGFAAKHHVPVGAIAGVALCQISFGGVPSTTGWEMAIWTSDGAKSTFQANAYIRPGASDPAGTKPAQIARDLWQRLTELQPENGPLRSLALQHQVQAGPPSYFLQVWCPDDGTSYKPGEQVTPVQAASAPVAGWYADPVEQGRLRWWDGTQWGQQAPATS